jgi:hypothetical protein
MPIVLTRRDMIAGLDGAAVCPMFCVRRTEQTKMIESLNGASPAPFASRL